MNNAMRGSKGNRRMVRSTSVVMSTANTTESRMNHPMKRFQISQMTGTVKTWLFRSRRLGAVAASFFLIVAGSALVIAQPASASTPPSWSTPTQIDGGRIFYGMSCTSTTFCMAVDGNGYALSYNGSTWSTPTQIDSAGGPLAAVSCTSSTFCMAVSYDGNAFAYNGTDWTTLTATWSNPIDGANYGQLDGVSCTSPTFCMAVDDSGYALAYNGTNWTTLTATWNNPIDTGGLTGVSCTSTTFCMAVGGLSSGSGSAASYIDGTWSTNLTAVNTGLYDVSCTSPSFCMAVAVSDDAASYIDGTWSTTTSIDPVSFNYNAVSCTSTTFCMAADSAGNAESYDGSGWTSPTHADAVSAPALTWVSCTSPSFCMAVDGSGNALLYSNQTITVAANGSPTFDQSGTYNVTASSNDTDSYTLAYTVDGTALNTAGCSVSPSGVVSFTSRGTCTIDVNSGGTENFGAATQAQQVLTVGAGVQTITVAATNSTLLDQSGIYAPVASSNDTDPGVLVYTVDGSGNTAGCTIADSSTGVVSFTDSGTCTIDVNSGSTANFAAAAQAQQVLTVFTGSPPPSSAQAALTLTSTSGTYGTALTLTSSGGSGTGAVSYTVANGTATGCAISGSSLSATAAGTCIVTATKAADTTYGSVSSTATTVTFAASTTTTTTTPPPPTTTTTTTPPPVRPHAAWVHGTPLAGRTVTVTIGGSGFYAAPTIRSSVAGTSARVTHDTGRLLTVRVTVRAGTAHGERTFTITDANGHACRVNYRQN